MLTGILSRRNTASHRLSHTWPRALPLGLPPAGGSRFLLSQSMVFVTFFCHLFRKHNDPEFFKSDDIKTGDTHRGMSPVKIHIMTSYGGIIRIRLKGRSSITSSQPANELPCFYQICNVSMLNHRQIYYSASGEIFKCDFLVHFYPLSFHDQGQRKRPPDSGESHNATQKNR